MRRLFCILCLGGAAIASGCSLLGQTASNIINPKGIQPGDRISGLEVVATNIYWAKVMEQYFGEVRFRGEMTISGTYQTPQTNENFPCFKVDERSFNRLPRMAEDERLCVCFSNPEEARRALSMTNRPVRNIISGQKKW